MHGNQAILFKYVPPCGRVVENSTFLAVLAVVDDQKKPLSSHAPVRGLTVRLMIQPSTWVSIVRKSSNFIQLCTTMWAWCRKFDTFGRFGRRPAAVDAAKLPRTREGSHGKIYI